MKRVLLAGAAVLTALIFRRDALVNAIRQGVARGVARAQEPEQLQITNNQYQFTHPIPEQQHEQEDQEE